MRGMSPMVAAAMIAFTIATPVALAEGGAATSSYALYVGCGSTTHCYEAGGISSSSGTAGTIARTTNGTSWRQHAAPSGVTFNDKLVTRDVACSTRSVCVVGGQKNNKVVVVRTSDSGKSWVSAKLPSSVRSAGSQVNAVACSSSNCFAVIDSAFVASRNGGSTWLRKSYPKLPSNTFLYAQALACPASATCLLIGLSSSGGTLEYKTTNRGKSWKSMKFPSSVSAGALSCKGTRCVAVGTEGSKRVAVYSSNVGSSWAVANLPNGIVATSTISCGSAKSCQALFQDSRFNPLIVRTADGGKTWTKDKLPGGYHLNDLTCPSSAVCVGVGSNASGNPAVLRTLNSGKAWLASKL